MKAIISLSGGMDSATVLAEAISQGREIISCVGFDYGSKHNLHELEAALKIAVHYQIPYSVIDLRNAMLGFKSVLIDKTQAIPEGHYEAENMRQTVVPARNIIFLSLLTGEAWSRGASEVWLGIHAGDHFIYPDCRPEFYYAMNKAISLGTDGLVGIKAPFLYGNKTTIIKRGLELGVPYHLTRTCYSSDSKACGRCGSCQERLAAWKANGLEDPLEYTSRKLLPEE